MKTNKKIRFKELNDYLVQNNKEFKEQIGFDWEEDREEDMGMEYYMSEMNQTVAGLYKTEAGLYKDESFIYFNNGYGLDRADLISTIITEAYEGILENTDTWDYLKLGGDDDVDYNASYIDIIIMGLRFAIENNCKSIQDFEE